MHPCVYASFVPLSCIRRFSVRLSRRIKTLTYGPIDGWVRFYVFLRRGEPKRKYCCTVEARTVGKLHLQRCDVGGRVAMLAIHLCGLTPPRQPWLNYRLTPLPPSKNYN